ncbi:MAG TPA: MtrB/PioB family outer membrane beta-barrel protein, partial [Vicinamibacterales bacterium]|nr:MtrB/PioB family outer membrane beta-barrel protein [Vicinamibacterales bacterium]
MRNITSITLVLLLMSAASARAQDPPTLPPPTDPVDIGRSQTTGRWYGTLDFGARATTIDGDDARFQRFRDLRPGVYATNAVAGRRTDDWTFEAQAWNAGYRDQRYQFELQRVGRLDASFLWDQIPLFISRDTRTLFTETQPGVFRIEDAVQQDIQTGGKTLRNFEDQAARFDLRTLRRIGQADVAFHATRDSDLFITITNITRDGQIPFGGSFGHSNAVELPVPVDWRITDVRTSYEWGNRDGMLRVGWDGSAFHNDIDAVIWDNPIRFGPDTTTAPSQGRFASWPGNSLMYLHGTGAVSLPGRSRLTGYLAIGQGRNDADLLPFTINTAVTQPALSRATTQAESNMRIAQFTFASRPARRVSVNARYRYADVAIDTPFFDRSGGSVSYDASFTASAHGSEYHSVTRQTFDADAGVEVAPYTSLKVGLSRLGTDYEHRLWETTNENVFRVSLDTTGNQYFGVRALFEDRRRTGEGFEAEALNEVGELIGMRHYDVADRDRRRASLIANVMPGGAFAFTASAGIGRDEYPDTAHGLVSFDSDQYSLGVSVAPDNRYDLFASYGWERYDSLQRSRNANSAADQANPLRDWTTSYDGKVDFLEAGVNINVIERTLIRVSGDWNKSN